MPNKGEWAETYAFLKLLVDGRMYVADQNLQQIDNAYFIINQALREGNRGHVLTFRRDEEAILGEDNGEVLDDLPSLPECREMKDFIWNQLLHGNPDEAEERERQAQNFLQRMGQAHPAAPAVRAEDAHYLKGTEDLVFEIEDYRNGLQQTLGFSCKYVSSSAPTLFNASKKATNFIYKLNGPINGEIQRAFNSIVDGRNHVSTKQRIQFLKSKGIGICFERPEREAAARNLILSGGLEMPTIVGELLKYYYWDCEAGIQHSSLTEGLNYLIEHDVAHYNLQNTSDIYSRKLRTLLYDMYCGMHFADDWDGRGAANGGFLIVKNNGQVLAFFNGIADQFRDYLLSSTRLESPGANKHKYMYIYRENDEYKIKFNLQIRFKRQR